MYTGGKQNGHTFLRVVIALLAAGAILITGFAVVRITDRRGFSLNPSYDPSLMENVGSFGSGRRLIRLGGLGSTEVVCTEGAHQPSIQVRRPFPKPVKSEASLVDSDPSTAFLAESAWQLCNAYANDVLSKAEYAKALQAIIFRQPARERTKKVHRRRPKKRHQYG